MQKTTVAFAAMLLLLLLAGCTFKEASIGAGPGCGNLECEAGEDPTSCPVDCAGCQDSDGINYYAAGLASETTGRQIADVCQDGILAEGFCYYGRASAFNHECAEGCANEYSCAGSGAEITQYCQYLNPDLPDSPNRNAVLGVGELGCYRLPDWEVLATCVADESGNPQFQIARDCTAGNLVCWQGDCLEPSQVPEKILEKKSLELSGGLGAILVNYNDAKLQGDTKQVIVSDENNEPLGNAEVFITQPAGERKALSTDSEGLVVLKLAEPGNYSVLATKDGYDEFTGNFSVSGIKIEFAEYILIGQEQALGVSTETGEPVKDAEISVSLPDGRQSMLTTDSGGNAKIPVQLEGWHTIGLIRNGVKIAAARFYGTTPTEMIVTYIQSVVRVISGGDAIEKTPVLANLLAILALASAAAAFLASGFVFGRGIKPEKARKKELLARLGAAAIAFALPVATNYAFGISAGIVVGVLAVAVSIVFAYAKHFRPVKAVKV